ncbi:MAG: sulfotransferase family protein [Acidimicrobiia bacterium]|nr:sulfotransferase family protein [Acidimicrobiia bacterium]
MSHPIYVLWATPRTASTAFEWMMRMRGDMACFHEPFGEWWYQGDGALWPRLDADSPRQPGLTYDSVMQKLIATSEELPVFSKEFPHYTAHRWDDEFFDSFEHSFLIRHPAKSLTSIWRNWPVFAKEEVGIDVQRRLFDIIADRTGKTPVVIDADDLLEEPQAIVEAYCEGIGIPYLEEALTWDPGDRDEVRWYDTEGVWHRNLMNSTGLTRQPRRDSDITKTPDWVQEMYQEFMPHYEHMHSYRLQPNLQGAE